MEKLYEKFDDLKYLFSYGEETDKERYESSWYNLYMDQTTGKLISRHFVNRDPFSLRQGSVSAYDYEKSYEELMKIVHAEKMDVSRFETLTISNWQKWLVKFIAVEKLNKATTEAECLEAKKMFESILDYEDSKKLSRSCLIKASNVKKKKDKLEMRGVKP